MKHFHTVPAANSPLFSAASSVIPTSGPLVSSATVRGWNASANPYPLYTPLRRRHRPRRRLRKVGREHQRPGRRARHHRPVHATASGGPPQALYPLLLIELVTPHNSAEYPRCMHQFRCARVAVAEFSNQSIPVRPPGPHIDPVIEPAVLVLHWTVCERPRRIPDARQRVGARHPPALRPDTHRGDPEAGIPRRTQMLRSGGYTDPSNRALPRVIPVFGSDCSQKYQLRQIVQIQRFRGAKRHHPPPRHMPR